MHMGCTSLQADHKKCAKAGRGCFLLSHLLTAPTIIPFLAEVTGLRGRKRDILRQLTTWIQLLWLQILPRGVLPVRAPQGIAILPESPSCSPSVLLHASP